MTGKSRTVPFWATTVGSQPWVTTTVLPRWPEALGIPAILRAISAQLSVSQPSERAKARASFSLPKRKST